MCHPQHGDASVSGSVAETVLPHKVHVDIQISSVCCPCEHHVRRCHLVPRSDVFASLIMVQHSSAKVRRELWEKMVLSVSHRQHEKLICFSTRRCSRKKRLATSNEISGGTETNRLPGTGQPRESFQETSTNAKPWHLSGKPPGTQHLAVIQVQRGKGLGRP